MKRAFFFVALLLGACRGAENASAPPPTATRPAPIDDEALMNGVYCSSDIVTEGPVRLANGQWSAEDDEGRQTLELGKDRARGDLDGDGREDAAVVLMGSGGGSGVFVDLALVLDRNGVPLHAASVALGDRVQVHGVSIEGNEVIVDVTQHGPGDPVCCPTQRVTRRFRYADGRLTDTAPPPPSEGPPVGEASGTAAPSS
ncbi:MAG TPA: hypothetical protein VFD06_11885 [Candidatus Polarisedimenticolia bacterium]|nr:hypothetical protein [Candidatus Polarisedimenticolia bacterium]